MPSQQEMKASCRRALLAMSAALLAAFPVARTAAAQQPEGAADPAKLRGSVVKIVKDGCAQPDSGQEQDVSFGSLPGEGLGNGAEVGATDVKQGSVKEQPDKDKDVQKTASIDVPTPGGPKATPPRRSSVEDGLSKSEIGVDWSHWVSTLADRWYFNLKNMEFRSGKFFRTVRPALIKFTCYRSGTVGNIALRQSCGVPAYDQMQIEALKRCMPLPPFPEGSRRMSYSLLQGWECHPRQAGEKDFKPGSYGKNFPVERVPLKSRAR